MSFSARLLEPSTETALEVDVGGKMADYGRVTGMHEGSSNLTQIRNASSGYFEHEQEICGLRSARTTSVAEMVACIIAVLTVLENGVILVAIARGNRSLRKPPYWFIASLATADLFTGLEVVIAVFVPIGDSPQSRITLKGLAVVTFIASINSLLFVSMDRYIRIVHHIDYKKILSRKTIAVLIFGSWFVSVGVFLIAPLLGWSCGSMHCCARDGMCTCLRSKFGDSCDTECSQSFSPFKKSYLIVGVVYFTVSVIAMTTFYSIIFKVVKEKTFGGADGKSHSNKRREIQLAKTLVITLGIFVICWLPVQGLFIADFVIAEHNDFLIKAFDYALVPSVINSFMNPIIYSIRLPHMRTTILRMFLPCWYDGTGKRGTSVASSTSLEKRTFRSSLRRKSNNRKRLKSASSTGGTKTPSPPNPTRDRLLPDKSVPEITPESSHA